MIVLWTMLGVLCAAVAGILIYRWGVCDGLVIGKRAGRTAVNALAKREREKAAQPDEQLVRQLQEIANFMQYDGGEMPPVNGGAS